jgi:hypothetical protein
MCPDIRARKNILLAVLPDWLGRFAEEVVLTFYSSHQSLGFLQLKVVNWAVYIFLTSPP